MRATGRQILRENSGWMNGWEADRAVHDFGRELFTEENVRVT